MSLTMSFYLFSEGEGTALCDIISNSYNSWQMKLHGDILINGVSVSPARLQDRVAYVRQDNNFSADMSVRQTMLFHAFLREPGTHARSRDTKGRVSVIPSSARPSVSYRLSVHDSEQNKIRRSADFQTLKLRNVLAGNTRFFISPSS